ncbi:MAG: RagB/SusD family nutrient uptake outer membrane protein, partial [Maribacter sp.]|nr:RagB/SusD family nutrient uptake outer membrane protein [Maribacter sp.]
MKKIYVFIVSLCFIGIFSCNDELDLQPLDRITEQSFYKTRANFDGAIFAAYSSIQDFWGTSTETLSERGEFWKISMTITDVA